MATLAVRIKTAAARCSAASAAATTLPLEPPSVAESGPRQCRDAILGSQVCAAPDGALPGRRISGAVSSGPCTTA